MARTLTRRARGPPGRYRGRAIKSPPYSCRSWPSKGSELKPCDGVAVAKLHAAAARSTGTLRKLKLLRRDAGALQKRALWQRCGAIRCHSSRFRNRNALLVATAHIYATPVLLPLTRRALSQQGRTACCRDAQSCSPPALPLPSRNCTARPKPIAAPPTGIGPRGRSGYGRRTRETARRDGASGPKQPAGTREASRQTRGRLRPRPARRRREEARGRGSPCARSSRPRSRTRSG